MYTLYMWPTVLVPMHEFQRLSAQTYVVCLQQQLQASLLGSSNVEIAVGSSV